MRVLALLRRALRELRAFWRANLRVAAEWRRDRRRLVRYVLLTWIVDALVLYPRELCCARLAHRRGARNAPGARRVAGDLGLRGRSSEDAEPGSVAAG